MVVEKMDNVRHCTWQEEPDVEAKQAMWNSWNTTNTIYIFLLSILLFRHSPVSHNESWQVLGKGQVPDTTQRILKWGDHGSSKEAFYLPWGFDGGPTACRYGKSGTGREPEWVLTLCNCYVCWVGEGGTLTSPLSYNFKKPMSAKQNIY